MMGRRRIQSCRLERGSEVEAGTMGTWIQGSRRGGRSSDQVQATVGLDGAGGAEEELGPGQQLAGGASYCHSREWRKLLGT